MTRVFFVYICHPLTTGTAVPVETNRRAAMAMASAVLELGALPVMTHHLPDTPQREPEWWHCACRDLVGYCDAVYTVPLSRRSTGCRVELRMAEDLGIPIFDALDDLGDFLESMREVQAEHERWAARLKDGR